MIEESNNTETINIERRKFSRLNGGFSAIAKTACLGEKIVVCENISLGGAFLHIQLNKFEQPDVNFICLKYEKIHIKINLRNNIDTVEALGITRWAKKIHSSEQDTNINYGIGIEFVDFPIGQKNKLAKYLSEHTPVKIENSLNIKLNNETLASLATERRSNSRRAVDLPVTFKYKSLFFRSHTKDLSTGGMFLVTDLNLKQGEIVTLIFSVPENLLPMKFTAEVVRVNKLYFTQGQCIPHGVGLKFISISQEQKNVLKKFLAQHRLRLRPEFKIRYEPRFCHLYVADLSVGCENKCTYCHFSRVDEKGHITDTETSTPVDITNIYTMGDLPEVLYLSPSSEAFTPTTSKLTNELFNFLLPKGVTFVIVTKGVIPDETIELIKKYPKQFEGITIGVTNLDPKRNSILEPYAPSAEERLFQIQKLLNTGIRIGVRMDPIFPTIDDTDENLNQMVQYTSKLGVNFLTATYIFSFGQFLENLKQIPFLENSVTYITEKSPMQGGLAYTVPFDKKIKTYEKLFFLCNSYGIEFNTCGCKENRLRDIINKLGYSTICRNKKYYQTHIK